MSGLLSERAMLTALHISSYSGNMFDQEATEEFNESFKADRKKAGRYNKKLVAPEFLAGISAAHNAARKTHRTLTLPWEDDGTRILTTKGYMKYTELMKEHRLRVQDEREKFIKTRDEFVAEGRVRLGDLFDEKDYPSTEELKTKFDFDVEIKPVPESSDFRAQVSNEQMSTIVKDIQRRADDRVKDAINDVFERVLVHVQHMRDKLHDYVPAQKGKNGRTHTKGEGRIHDTLVYNIHELAEIMPILNITNDQRLNDLAQQLSQDLGRHSPERLRSDDKLRHDTMSKADKLLKKVHQYMK
jgi:hypothetical protein